MLVLKKKKSKRTKYYYFLVFENEEGTLQKLIENKRKDGLTFKENLHLLECLCQGLTRLKEEDWAHNNLKPENIVLNAPFNIEILINRKIN